MKITTAISYLKEQKLNGAKLTERKQRVIAFACFNTDARVVDDFKLKVTTVSTR